MEPPGRRGDAWRRRASAIVARRRAGHDDEPSAHRSPPGDLDPLDVLEKTDRAVFVERAHRYGPVFTGVVRDEPTVCIVGLATCRRFLQQHADALAVETLDLTGLFPLGFLRALHGSDHLEYRRRLMRAVRAADADVHPDEFESLADALLDQHARLPTTEGDRPETWSATASAIATSVLVRVFFGADGGSALHRELVDGFHDLGPHGLVWHPQERQHVAFDRLCATARAALGRRTAGADGGGELSPTSLVAVLDDAGELDDTMLGNLVYMVEMGRSDIHNFLRWLSRYAAADADLCAAVVSGARAEGSRPVEERLVLEVLRAHQSERLERRLTRDVEFDGFVFRGGTPVRMCTWESHHDASVFADPFELRPDRWATAEHTNDQFAPFGLDHHQCPFGTLSMRLGTGFLRALCRHRPVLLADGPPRRGAYHWEPARQLAIRLEPR